MKTFRPRASPRTSPPPSVPIRWLGTRARTARDSLRSLASVTPTELPSLVRAALAIGTLRSDVLAPITALRLDASSAAGVGNVLLANWNGWTFEQRLHIGAWLWSCGVPDWRIWCADVVEFLPSLARSNSFGLELLRLARERLGVVVPATLFCSDEVLARAPDAMTPYEAYVLADRRFRVAPADGDHVLALLSAAVSAQLPSTVAALFAHGYLDKVAVQATVIEAFHSVDWRRFGTIKRDFLARAAQMAHPPSEGACHRFVALQRWACGNFEEAVERLELLVPIQPEGSVHPSLVREYLTAFAALGGRRTARQEALLDTLRRDTAQSDTATHLEFAMTLAVRGSLSVSAAERLASNLSLPPPTDPLFGLVATLLVRRFWAEQQHTDIRSLVLRRIVEVDPLWFTHVPYPEMEYAQLISALRVAGHDARALAASLSRLSLLPTDWIWIREVLALVLEKAQRTQLEFVDAAGIPTPLGAALWDACRHAVAGLEEAGLSLSDRDATALTVDPHPIEITRTLVRVLERFEHAS